MIPNLINSKPPMGYAVCLSETCPLREKCLRALLGEEIRHTAETMNLVNPQHPNYREGAECVHFRSSEPEKYARGFSRAMSELSKRNYSALSERLRAETSKTQFYRMKKGEIALSPREQAEIIALLRAYGYTGDDPFDSYEERLTW